MSAAPTSGAQPPSVSWPLYSADDHLDIWALPPDVWTSRVAAADRERVPRVVDRDGTPTWVVDGSVLGVSGIPTGGRYSALSRAGLGDQPHRPATPPQRLEDMDRDQIRASVIYGPAVMGLPIADPELKATCWRAWNDFATEFNAEAPDRLALLPVLPSHDPRAAAGELERMASHDHRGALVYCFEIDCGDPAWDALWATAQDTGLPISFHIGGGVTSIPIDPASWAHHAFAAVVPMQLCEPLATMVFCGALERHPGMRLVLAEAGIGWLPYFVSRMDTASAKRPGVARDYELRARPSEIFFSQVHATFEEEDHGASYIELLGSGNVMWASDYPHVDSTFPESAASIRRSFATLAEGDCRRVTADNCRELYGFG